HAEGVEDAADAVARHHGDDARGGRGTDTLGGGSGAGGADAFAHPALLFDLLVEIGHPDARRAPLHVERRLDGGTDVVRVDVAVPHPVPADHDDGVADAGPDVLEALDGVVGRGEHVHDLVPQVADVGVFAVRAGGALGGVRGEVAVEGGKVGRRHAGGWRKRAAVQDE